MSFAVSFQASAGPSLLQQPFAVAINDEGALLASFFALTWFVRSCAERRLLPPTVKINTDAVIVSPQSN